MLRPVSVGVRSMERYRPVAGDEALEELYAISSELRGARVAHINATANGGGVAEILSCLVPLYRNLGINVS